LANPLITVKMVVPTWGSFESMIMRQISGEYGYDGKKSMMTFSHFPDAQ